MGLPADVLVFIQLDIVNIIHVGIRAPSSASQRGAAALSTMRSPI
jgi:hypothetical protein